MNSKDLKYPPTAVGGIKAWFYFLICRKDLNNPPTAVVGIWIFHETIKRNDELRLKVSSFLL